MRAEIQLEALLAEAKSKPLEELPRFLAGLREVEVTAMARLTSPALPAPEDRLLTAPEAAHRLGMSKDWLYTNSKHLPFVRRNGRALRFSSLGIEQFIRAKKRP